MKKFFFSLAMACLSLLAVAQNSSQQEQMRAMMLNQSRTEVKSIQSKILNAERQYTVYLPAGYQTQTDRTYPVLYLLHVLSK